MDGGIICNEPNVQKCDYLYVINDSALPTALFVELKGNDIRHAVKQIQASLDMYGEKLNKRICARIICSSVPRMYNDPLFKNLNKKLMKQYNGNLHIYEKSKDEKYSDI